MTFQSIDYLSGLTQAEAVNFIKHLPAPTESEIEDLFTAAQKKPLSRQGSYDATETVKLRIRYIIEFLKTKPAGATRREIDAALKYNGANMRRALSEAINSGMICIQSDGPHKAILYKAKIQPQNKRPASTTNGRRSGAEQRSRLRPHSNQKRGTHEIF